MSRLTTLTAVAVAAVIIMAQSAIAQPEVWPVAGAINDPFGAGRDHSGLDIEGVTGEPVHAVEDGEVVSAEADGGYGNMVCLQHPDEETCYAHLSEIDVGEGEELESGEVLGKVGATGYATGDHLHFEIRQDGEAVDPLPLLPDEQVTAPEPEPVVPESLGPKDDVGPTKSLKEPEPSPVGHLARTPTDPADPLALTCDGKDVRFHVKKAKGVIKRAYAHKRWRQAHPFKKSHARRVKQHKECIYVKSSRKEIGKYRKHRLKSFRKWRKEKLADPWESAFKNFSGNDQGWAHQTSDCESGHNANTNTGNGFLGAFQFMQSTWNSAISVIPGSLPSAHGTPTDGSWYEQAVVAIHWRNHTSASQWPRCGVGHHGY